MLNPTETINQITGDAEARLAAVRAERDRYREELEWITRNLTDACTDLNGNIAAMEECEGCKLTIQEVIHRATNALKGA